MVFFMNDKLNKDYYKAYEKRYKQLYEKNVLWTNNLSTPDVFNFISDYNVSYQDEILDLGCGEGRDAIYLLNKGYDVCAIDYSLSVINMCNKLSNSKYIEHFKQFDLFEDKMNKKFKYIYSVAVLHMFVLKEHRDKFLSFIKNHLTNTGYCLICVMGDGREKYVTNIDDAFKNSKRVVMDSNKTVNIATTSCKIVNWEELIKEIQENDLIIEKRWISKEVPGFNSSMCVIVKKKSDD